MSNNVTSIEGRKPIRDRIREGRARVAAMSRGTISYLNKLDAEMAAAADRKEKENNIRRLITLEIRKAYAVFDPREASQIVSEAHEEVRKSKGVQS